MKQSTFALTRFENQSGLLSWRVEGRLHGIRIRKNVQSREEAAAEKATLELKSMQAASGLRMSTTFLTDAQLREAEAAYQRLIGQPRSLACYLDYALTNYRAPELDVALGDAAAEYVAAIRNVPEAKRERAFLNAAKTEAMNQTVRANGNGVRP